MYADETILLPNNLPRRIREDVAYLQKLYDEGNELIFDVHYEAIESGWKEFLGIGAITDDVFQKLISKYGI